MNTGMFVLAGAALLFVVKGLKALYEVAKEMIDIFTFGNNTNTKGMYLVRCIVPGKAPMCIYQSSYSMAERVAFEIATKFDLTVKIYKDGTPVMAYYNSVDAAYAEE